HERGYPCGQQRGHARAVTRSASRGRTQSRPPAHCETAQERNRQSPAQEGPESPENLCRIPKIGKLPAPGRGKSRDSTRSQGESARLFPHFRRIEGTKLNLGGEPQSLKRVADLVSGLLVDPAHEHERQSGRPSFQR